MTTAAWNRLRSRPSAALPVAGAVWLFLAVWLTPCASAQDVVGADEIIRTIKPRTRGITFRESNPNVGRIDLPAIQFEFDSDRLTPSALEQLRELSKALVSTTLQPSSFSIQGHTDSTGTREYNRLLSQRRARAVKRYLAEYAGVAGSRLVEVGLGEDYPIPGLQASDDRNRRVEIVNLGGAMAAAGSFEVGQPAAERRAVLIGIDAYQSVSPLKGPANDAIDMAELLVEQAGFKQRDVRVLLDNEATRVNILAAIEEWLIEGTNSGDDVLLYFSGHGFQQPDADGDESDRLDETLVPVDAWVDEGRVVRGMITDDEIGALLERLAGRRVYVVVDACHSGTSTRAAPSNESWRYVKAPRLPDGAPLRVSRSRGVSGTVAKSETFLRPSDSNMIVWTAVRADQKALVDREAVSRPGSVFTRRLLSGMRGSVADRNADGNVAVMELHEYLLGESERYCERYPQDCRNGLTPQLEAATSRFEDAAFDRSNAVSRTAALAKDILVQAAPEHDEAIQLSIKPGTRLRLDSTLEIVVQSDRSGFLTLLDIDAGGRLVQIFPNELSLRGGVPASISPGQVIRLPGERAGFQFQTTPPTGRGLLVAVVSDESDRVAALTSRHKDLSVAPSPEAYLVEISEALRAASMSETDEAAWSVGMLEYEVISP